VVTPYSTSPPLPPAPKGAPGKEEERALVAQRKQVERLVAGVARGKLDESNLFL
jgi:hypothetical protein